MLERGAQVLGRYTIDRLRHQSEAEHVYEGTHRRLSYRVVIHVLHAHDDEIASGRFERSARMMSKVRHSNVVSILDYGVSDAGACIITELVRGHSLEEILRAHEALPWPEAVEIATEALWGLQALHAAGVLHRNVTPENLVVLPGERALVKLVGMGLAKSVDPSEVEITQDSQLVGTPTYMAPEQLYPEMTVDHRADIYALGLVLYQALSGVLPEGKPPLTVRHIVPRMDRTPQPPPVPSEQPPLPPSLQVMITRLLSLRPEDRPESAKEAAQAFREILDEPTLQDKGPSPQFEAAAPARARPQPPAQQSRASASPRAARTAALAPPHAQFPRMAGDPWRALAARGAVRGSASQVRSKAVSADSVNEPLRAILAVRVPDDQLGRNETTWWLTKLVEGSGRAFFMDKRFWVVILEASDPDTNRQRLSRMQAKLMERFGPRTKVASRLVSQRFEVPSASVAGTAPPPVQVLRLLDEVAGY